MELLKKVKLGTLIGLIIAFLTCVAAWLVVPPIQRFLWSDAPTATAQKADATTSGQPIATTATAVSISSAITSAPGETHPVSTATSSTESAADTLEPTLETAPPPPTDTPTPTATPALVAVEPTRLTPSFGVIRFCLENRINKTARLCETTQDTFAGAIERIYISWTYRT